MYASEGFGFNPKLSGESMTGSHLDFRLEGAAVAHLDDRMPGKHLLRG